MRRLTFSATINALAERVWRTLLEDATYREWTSEFHEGSYAVTDWKEGSKALFLGPEGDGMVSRIRVHKPNEFLEIEHLGEVRKGVEDRESEAAKQWAGGRESYTLRKTEGGVELTVETDTTDQYKTYFEETWPKALARLKRICEREAGMRAG